MDAVPAAGQRRLALRTGNRADDPALHRIRSLGQLNTLSGVILAETGFLLPYAILILAPYFDAIPSRVGGGRAHRRLHALGCAFPHRPAAIDPGLAACGVIMFIISWHELLIPLILNARPDFMTLPVVIASLVGDVFIFFNLMMAIGLLALLPTVVLVIAAEVRGGGPGRGRRQRLTASLRPALCSDGLNTIPHGERGYPRTAEGTTAGRQSRVNGWLAIPSGFSAEVMAQCGWDSVTVDMQHGVQDYQTMVHCFQAMDRFPVTKLVRVPWNEPGIVGKVLDAGAYGVICPMVNTREEAQALVSYSAIRPRASAATGRSAPGHMASPALPADRQRRDPGHPDDRDPPGDREHRRDPRRAGHERSMSAPPISASRWERRRSSTARSRGGHDLEGRWRLPEAQHLPGIHNGTRPMRRGCSAWASALRSRTTAG